MFDCIFRSSFYFLTVINYQQTCPKNGHHILKNLQKYASGQALKILHIRHIPCKIASHLPGFSKAAAILDFLFFFLPAPDETFGLASILGGGSSDRKYEAPPLWFSKNASWSTLYSTTYARNKFYKVTYSLRLGQKLSWLLTSEIKRIHSLMRPGSSTSVRDTAPLKRSR